MNYEDLDALLESKYENDLEDQILELESGNENLDETFGEISLNSQPSKSHPVNLNATHQPALLPNMQYSQMPSHSMAPHPMAPHPMAIPIPMAMPPMGYPPQILNTPPMGHTPPMGGMPMHIPGMPMNGMPPMAGFGPRKVNVENMMTMEDVEKLLTAQVQHKVSPEKKMNLEDVENLLKGQLKVQDSNVDRAPKESNQERRSNGLFENSQVAKASPSNPKELKDNDSRDNLSKLKEKKNRVHLEKIHRPSQAERRMDKSKNKNLQNFFYQREPGDRLARKKDIFITNWEKELIAKIQISQLVSNDPMKDDFYYEIYTSFSKKIPEPSVKESGKTKKKNAGINKIQQQMARLIEKRKTKTKEAKATMSLEGALGKISVMSSRNPRQILSLDSGFNTSNEKSKVEFTFSPKTVLDSIEKVYDNVLELEYLKRIEKSDETDEEWRDKFNKQLTELWVNLGLSRPVSYSMPHPFGFFLKFSKGIRIIPRALKFLTNEQQFELFSSLMCRLECVEIANLPLSAENPEIDVFMAYVIPPFVDYVSEIGLDLVNSLMKIILERHNMVWVATSKIGLAFLTAYLSRAELLKQGGPQQGSELPNESDLTLWNDIYNFLFSSIQGSFSSLFPAKKSDKSEALPGEIYIWQFLASLAVCATNVDQQTILVTEVRENIITTAKTKDPKALANVDLFLTALGLGIDATQLASSV